MHTCNNMIQGSVCTKQDPALTKSWDCLECYNSKWLDEFTHYIAHKEHLLLGQMKNIHCHPVPGSLSFNSKSRGTSMEFGSWRRDSGRTLGSHPGQVPSACLNNVLLHTTLGTFFFFTQQHSARPVCRKPQRNKTRIPWVRGQCELRLWKAAPFQN